MTAIVVEIKRKKAALLTHDGRIVLSRNKNYTIGDVIEMSVETIQKTKRKTAAKLSIAAVFAVCIIFGAGMCFLPYSHVSLDVNPSVQYDVNRFNQVLSVKALNEDGEKILQKLNLKFKNIDNALAETVKVIDEEGYFIGDADGLMIATYCNNEANAVRLAERLRIRTQTQLKECGVEVEAVSVGRDLVSEAKSLGVTPGKLNLVRRLIESSADPDSIDLEQWLDQPVKDIMRAIQENKDTGNPNKTQQGNSNDNQTINGNGQVNNSGNNGSGNNDNGNSEIDNKNNTDKGNKNSSDGNSESSDTGSGNSNGKKGN